MKRLTLALALIAGKGLDALSTIVVLPASPNFYESQWLAALFIDRLGLVVGMLASAALAVLLIALLAESGEAIARLAPEDWTPDWYPGAIRVGIYLVAATWYAIIGVGNFVLVL